MALIYTSTGETVKVDDADFGWLSQYSWRLCRGYAITTIGKRPNRRNLYMHRLIMDEPGGMQIDHVNRIRLDNQRSNLRVCTHVENMKNKSAYRQYKTNKSGVAGVSFLGKLNKWRASFQKDGARQYRNFSHKDDAIVMAIKMRAEI